MQIGNNMLDHNDNGTVYKTAYGYAVHRQCGHKVLIRSYARLTDARAAIGKNMQGENIDCEPAATWHTIEIFDTNQIDDNWPEAPLAW